MDTFWKELKCSSWVHPNMSGWDGPSFSRWELLAPSVAPNSFNEYSSSFKHIIETSSSCTFPTSGWISYSGMVCDCDPAALVALPPVGGSRTPFISTARFRYIIFVSYSKSFWTEIKMVSAEGWRQSKISPICVMCSVPLSHSPDCIWTNGGSCCSCSS